jgi:hypothetical protein
MCYNNNLDQNLLDNRSKVLNLLISQFKYKRKPKPENRAGIKASFFNPDYSLQSATLDELVTYIGHGQSITPAFLLKSGPEKGPSKSSKFISQQLWMVDIDNHNDFDKKGNRRLPDENLCIANIFTICEAYQCQPFLVYESFSSTRSLPRYRVAFISSEPITDMETRNRVAEAFYWIFKSEFCYTDKKSKEVAQLFYGTSRDRILHIDYNAVFDVQALIQSCPVNMAAGLSGVAGNVRGVGLEHENRDVEQPLQNPSNNHTKNKHAYITWGIKNCETDPRYIESNRVPWDHLTRYSAGEDFCCEFHDDSSPSAAIAEVDRGHGIEYFYFCRAEGCKHRRLSQVEYLHETQKITKTTALKKVLRCRQEVEPLCELLDKLSTVRKDYPEESRAWRFAVTNSDEILKLFVEAAIENSIVVGDSVRFPLAESAICAELNKRNVPGRSAEAVHRKVKDFECYAFLIRSVSDEEMEEIPGALDYFVAEQGEQKHARHCKWWEIPLKVDLRESIRAATERLRDDKQRGKRGCITREGVLMTKSPEEADRLFNQDIGREVSQVTVNLYRVAKLVLRGLLDTYGWTQEWRILEFLAGNWTYQGFKCFMGQERKKQKLREIWPGLLEDLDAEFRVINQGLRKRFGIPDSINQGTKIVYRRIEKVQAYRPYPARGMSLYLNVPKPIKYVENQVLPFWGTLRERIKLHVHYEAGELHRLDTKTQLEIFEDLRWESKEWRERQRREFRELVIPQDTEEFDRLLRTRYGYLPSTE